MQWLRLYHDAATDPKWRVIARRSGQPVVAVMALWMLMLVKASESEDRGRLGGWDDEDAAAALDMVPEQVCAIREAMQGKVLDGLRLTGWERRQPKREREDNTAAERKRQQRERERSAESAQNSGDQNRDAVVRDTPDSDNSEPCHGNVTPCHASVTPCHTQIREEEIREEKKEDSPPPPSGGHESDPFSEPELFRGLPVDPEKTSVRKPRAKPLFTPSEIDKFFNEFASAYPSRHKDHSWPGSKKLFVAALKRNVDPKAIIAGAARYCQEVKNDGSFGTNYTKDAFNWLNEKKWEEYSGIHKFPVSEPEWKTNPRAWTNTQHPPPWPDAPWGTRAGLWMKTSKIWVKNAS